MHFSFPSMIESPRDFLAGLTLSILMDNNAKK